MVPSPRIDRAIIADRIAAVVVAGPNGKQRHQVQVGDSQLLKVADLLAQPAKILAEQIDIECTADRPFRLKPIGLVEPMRIEFAQVRRGRCMPSLGTMVSRICSR